MSITVPTSDQIGARAERIARALAIGLAWLILAAKITYECGYALGRIVHTANDWLARASHAPVAEATKAATAAVAWADKALTPAPAPVPTFAQVLAAEGIKPFTPAELDEEIARFDAAQQAKPARPAARRKPATARKAKKVAA